MPTSHQRHKPKHHHQAPHTEHKKKKIYGSHFYDGHVWNIWTFHCIFYQQS
jgi:hypothetical protein